jgi:hypothetical protein
MAAVRFRRRIPISPAVKDQDKKKTDFWIFSMLFLILFRSFIYYFTFDLKCKSKKKDIFDL